MTIGCKVAEIISPDSDIPATSVGAGMNALLKFSNLKKAVSR